MNRSNKNCLNDHTLDALRYLTQGKDYPILKPGKLRVVQTGRRAGGTTATEAWFAQNGFKSVWNGEMTIVKATRVGGWKRKRGFKHVTA